MSDNTIRHHGDPEPQADFYLGRGASAHYLGTTILAREQISLDCFRSLEADEYTQDHYLRVVRTLTGRHQNDSPRLVPPWPHEHADSTDTPWTYCYDKGTVYVYRYGVEMLQVRCNTHRWDGPAKSPDRRREWRPVNEFPPMRES